MNRTDMHEQLSIIDLLSEGHDWFTLIAKESALEIANRIKATPTARLVQIMDGAICESTEAQPLVLDFAQKEFATRLANGNSNPNGDPLFTEKIAGYDKFDKSIHEELSADDPVETWIADFIKSDDPRFDGKTKKERINMALGAFHGAQKKEDTIQEKRDLRIVSLATNDADENILRFFLESNDDIVSKSVLKIKDLYEAFIFDLIEAAITVGEKGTVKCVKQFGACKIGDTYTGVWRQAAWQHQLRLDLDRVLPRATAHPMIFFDKNTNQLTIPKQFELL